jgi:hypothetical protein
MDKTIEQLFKVFSHLARDIQNYLFSGFIIIFNIYLLDYFYYSSSIWKEIANNKILIPSVIVAAYILGHISLGFYTLIIEWAGVDTFLNRELFKKRFPDVKIVSDSELISAKLKTLNNNKELYLHFIEREYNLSNMRWNYSAAFLLISLCDFTYLIFDKNVWQILMTAILSFFAAMCLLLISIFTQKENAAQLKSLQGITRLS